MPRSAPVSKVAFSPMMPANGGQELGNKVSGRLAEPDIQDGRYGFGGRDEPIDVDVEEDRERNQPAVDSTRRDNRRFDDKRDDRREYGRDYPRDDRRDDYNRGYRRGGGYEARKLYSDDLYSSPQQRGRSFR